MMAGIIKILSHVSVFGRFQCEWYVCGGRPSVLLPGVKMFIDYLGEFPPEAPNLNEIVDAGTQYSLQTTELLQQLTSFDRPQARNGFQYRLVVTLGPCAPVSRDRETMRLVTHALNQMQGTGVRWQYSGRILAQQEQLLLSGPAIGTFCDANQRDSRDAEFLDHLGCLGQLTLATIDQQHVGLGCFPVADPLVAPRQRLVHRGIVIAGCN